MVTGHDLRKTSKLKKIQIFSIFTWWLVVNLINYLKSQIRNGMMCNQLDGIFTFALIYEKEFLVARDPIGIKPLYYGIDKEGRYLFR